MNPTKLSRGAAKGGGRGAGGRNGGRGYAYLSKETRMTPSSNVSETSTKRTKYDDTTDDASELFPATRDESTSSNWKNKALTRSSPHCRQAHKKSDE